MAGLFSQTYLRTLIFSIKKSDNLSHGKSQCVIQVALLIIHTLWNCRGNHFLSMRALWKMQGVIFLCVRIISQGELHMRFSISPNLIHLSHKKYTIAKYSGTCLFHNSRLHIYRNQKSEHPIYQNSYTENISPFPKNHESDNSMVWNVFAERTSHPHFWKIKIRLS